VTRATAFLPKLLLAFVADNTKTLSRSLALLHWPPRLIHLLAERVGADHARGERLEPLEPLEPLGSSSCWRTPGRGVAPPEETLPPDALAREQGRRERGGTHTRVLRQAQGCGKPCCAVSTWAGPERWRTTAV
jgi:hypothetical protein